MTLYFIVLLAILINIILCTISIILFKDFTNMIITLYVMSSICIIYIHTYSML